MNEKHLKEIAKELKLIRKELQKSNEDTNEGISKEVHNALWMTTD